MGLSKEEVITQLGKPESTEVHDSVYRYDAGEKTSYVGFGGHTYYKLYVKFDENGKVKSTSIEIYSLLADNSHPRKFFSIGIYPSSFI